MARAFASGKHAIGYCDRCGWEYKLGTLRRESRNGQEINLLVCSDCWDKQHPQEIIGNKLDMGDPIALKNPRPDASLRESRSDYGWKPVLGMEATTFVGKVNIL